MHNPETLATLDTQDTGQRQTKQGAIKNGQSRESGNMYGYCQSDMAIVNQIWLLSVRYGYCHI
jgi:hypothetical protein